MGEWEKRSNGQLLWESPWVVEHGHWQYNFLRSLVNTTATGTSKIQRNLIAERD